MTEMFYLCFKYLRNKRGNLTALHLLAFRDPSSAHRGAPTVAWGHPVCPRERAGVRTS